MRYLFAALTAALALPALAADLPKFKAQEIDTGLKIGYAVVVVDVAANISHVIRVANPKRQGRAEDYFVLRGVARYTILPPTTVYKTTVCGICTGGIVKMSRSSTTMSASLPISRLPFFDSSKEA